MKEKLDGLSGSLEVPDSKDLLASSDNVQLKQQSTLYRSVNQNLKVANRLDTK